MKITSFALLAIITVLLNCEDKDFNKAIIKEISAQKGYKNY